MRKVSIRIEGIDEEAHDPVQFMIESANWTEIIRAIHLWVHHREPRGRHCRRRRTHSPIQRVNVDFTQDMLNELDQTAVALNISRQAVIKTFIRQSLDQLYLARKAKKAG